MSIESSKTLTRAIEKPLRLVISDVFRGGVQNPVSVSGRVNAGYFQEGDVLVSMPSKEQATVKAIVSNEEPQKWAVAGHNVVVHLSGIDPIHLRLFPPISLLYRGNFLTRYKARRCPLQPQCGTETFGLVHHKASGF